MRTRSTLLLVSTFLVGFTPAPGRAAPFMAKSTIDQDVLYATLQKRVRELEGMALRDAVSMTRKAVPEATADFLTTVVDQLISEQDRQGFTLVVTDAAEGMAVSVLSGVLAGTLPFDAATPSPTVQASNVVASERGAYTKALAAAPTGAPEADAPEADAVIHAVESLDDFARAVFYADLGYHALRGDEEVRAIFALEPVAGVADYCHDDYAPPETDPWRPIWVPKDHDAAVAFFAATKGTAGAPGVRTRICTRAVALGRVLADVRKNGTSVDATALAGALGVQPDVARALGRTFDLMLTVSDSLRGDGVGGSDRKPGAPLRSAEALASHTGDVLTLLRDPGLRQLLFSPNTMNGAPAYRDYQGASRSAKRTIRLNDLAATVLEAVGDAVDVIPKSDVNPTPRISIDLVTAAGTLSKEWYRRDGFTPYLSIGMGELAPLSTTLAPADLSTLAAERIGVVYRHRFKAPALADKLALARGNSFHAGFYGSGILYSLQLDGSDTTFISGGGMVGVTLAGLLDVNLGAGPLYDVNAGGPTAWQANLSMDLPLHEYLSALSRR